MKDKTAKRLGKLLYKRLREKYGVVISQSDVEDFLNRLDDLREVNETHVDYLYDYVIDYELY